jgi:hypothetical protein
MQPWLMAAAALSLATGMIHVVVGGRFIAQPLLRADELRRVPKYTSYYCWHLVTITVLMMSIMFAWAAAGGGRELALLAVVQAAAFTVWNIVLILWQRLSPLHFPQWAPFLLVTISGAIGLA